MTATSINTKTFRDIIFSYHSRNRRSLPWRDDRSPYRVLISEIMLQQTQVERVLSKYELFIAQFHDFSALAGADIRSILMIWMGLGYNRRAMALKSIALKVIDEHEGILPDTLEGLISLPGIGRATAGAILCFAYDKPAVFIETNIRRVFIHYFFDGRETVRDSEILSLVAETIDRENPREWYYALMDYGSMLRGMTTNPNRRSAHYTRQSSFEGSDRQIRGKILTLLLSLGPMKEEQLINQLGIEQARAVRIMKDLAVEGFLKKRGRTISMA
jgi:A/G-specific adenine glycosylase